MTRLGIALLFCLSLAAGSAWSDESNVDAAGPESSELGMQKKQPKPYVPGEGYQLFEGELGSLNVTAYALLRFLDQLPGEQKFLDHLGREQLVEGRRDIQLHRVLLHFKGFLFNPRLTQQTSIWAVNSTNSVTAFAAINYKFAEAFVLGGGIGALPGTRSMNYEHPYFLGTDRQMADEFFRPSFTSGIWVSGKPLPKLEYRVMLGDNLNIVDITAKQLMRDYAVGWTVAWYPSTGEFGPKGGFGDFEMHDRLATRFGASGTQSRVDRLSQVDNPYPDQTTVRLSDSLAFFQTGSLAPDATVQKANFALLAVDAGMKYRGFFLFAEAYFRRLSNFQVFGGPVPLTVIDDTGFMVQSSYMAVEQKLEFYGSYSQLYGQFNRAMALTGGANFYPYKSRSFKLNGSLTYVDRSPVSSFFGYFVGGQKGPTTALSADYLF